MTAGEGGRKTAEVEEFAYWTQEGSISSRDTSALGEVFSLESFKGSECGECLHQLGEPFISSVNKINVPCASMRKPSAGIRSVGELGANRKRQYRDTCSARERAWYQGSPRVPSRHGARGLCLCTCQRKPPGGQSLS